jgi:hypothetical protein
MNTAFLGFELPVGPRSARVEAGPTGRAISQKRAWRLYVERRRSELHDAYPCAVPTRRRRCPKHSSSIGPISGLCKTCRDELYQQLAADYPNLTKTEEKMNNEIEIYEPAELAEQHQVPAAGLFGTDDPKLVVTRAAQVADELARVIRNQKLSVRINSREHVLVEGWTLLGTMLGVFPVLSWTRRLEDGWEARVEARTLAGATVGAAESECLRGERRWAKADDYAIRSMSQTRATSKALRQPLGFVMQLAGFEATPAEEMPGADGADRQPAPRPAPAPAPERPTVEQLAHINELLAELAVQDAATDWRAKARELAGVSAEKLTREIADDLVGRLRAELATSPTADDET